MSDTAYPNVLVVNADGTISAALSGSLRLPADTGNSPAFLASQEHSISWADSAGRTVAAHIGVVGTRGDQGIASQRAYTPNGNSMAEVIEWVTPTFASVMASAVRPGQAADIEILGADGRSGFVQLRLGTGRVVISERRQFSTPIMGTGGKFQATINHFLGTQNIVVCGSLFDFAVNNPSAGSWAWIQDDQSNDSVTIEVQAVGSAAIRTNWCGFVIGFFT